jgi:hypothetical protein
VDATLVMFSAMSADPRAASLTLCAISDVVAVCCSTADAIAVCSSATCAITSPICPIASTAPPESVWIAPMRSLISSVALAVCVASSLTSLATTAKPLPASPARAAGDTQGADHLTVPVRVFGVPDARPDSAARAAA